MREFIVVRQVPLTQQQTWERLTDWERHGDYVPFTKVSRTDDGILARTALGRIGFDDPMRIVDQHAPAICRLVKTGSVVRGDVEVRIDPASHGSTVTWTERVDVKGVPRVLDPLVALAGRFMFGRVIDRLLA